MTEDADLYIAMNESLNKIKNTTSRITGRGGEDAACRFLEEQGFRVLQRNYRVGHYEIDIIAENDKYIVFVEVKTRTDKKYNNYGRPSAAVGLKKRRCLAFAAERYIKSHKNEKMYRFDVVEVLVCSDKYDGHGSYKINHMKGVFGALGKIWI